MFNIGHFVWVLELPNYTNTETMIIELVVGGFVALGLFVVQIRMSRKVNDFLKHKAELEQKHKTSQCERIIEILKDIEERDNYVKKTLEGYDIQNSTNETSNFFIEATVLPFKYKIQQISNAMGQLQESLNDPTFGREFKENLGWFNMLPMYILIDRIPQQAIQQHQIDGIISDIDKQLKKIQEFVGKFTEEMESSLAEKSEENQSVTRKIVDQRKYFIAPNLSKLIR
jgi:hypothetical protein